MYPFFESDTLFLEWVFVLCLVVQRFVESRDVETVPSDSILGIPEEYEEQYEEHGHQDGEWADEGHRWP